MNLIKAGVAMRHIQDRYNAVCEAEHVEDMIEQAGADSVDHFFRVAALLQANTARAHYRAALREYAVECKAFIALVHRCVERRVELANPRRVGDAMRELRILIGDHSASGFSPKGVILAANYVSRRYAGR